MSKCYYCGSMGRGCPECNQGSRADMRELRPVGAPLPAAQPDAWVPQPGAQERFMHGSPAWVPMDVVTFKERRPISSDFKVDYTTLEPQAWVAECAHQVRQLDHRITLELVHEPAEPMRLVARTVYEEEPEATRHRVQQWNLEAALKNQHQNTPAKMAEYLVGYWQRARERAAAKRAALALEDVAQTYADPRYAMKAPTIDELEQSIKQIEERFPESDRLKNHPNCRCVTTPTGRSSWSEPPWQHFRHPVAIEQREFADDALTKLAQSIAKHWAERREQMIAGYLQEYANDPFVGQFTIPKD